MYLKILEIFKIKKVFITEKNDISTSIMKSRERQIIKLNLQWKYPTRV